MSFMTNSVTRKVSLNAPVSEVWGLVGNFHGLAEWHPAVESSTREAVGDEEFRLLKIAGGGEILEHLVAKTSHSYTYAIIRSPLPVDHYEAKIEANTAGGGTEITWSSSFTPTAENSDDVVAGIYQAGLDALAARFGG
ncbi:MAG TPA: SRPBCC family protein [Thermohalobaculum sp.]|nr:SRPBCC family protein [Thermohalobaculum sp.]